MLYPLDRNELQQLRSANWTGQYTGAALLVGTLHRQAARARQPEHQAQRRTGVYYAKESS